MSLADLKNLPSLPGYSFPEFKERHHKPQTWNVVNGQRIEQKEGLSHDKGKFVKAPRPEETWRTGSLPDSTTRAIFKQQGDRVSELHELPAWDAYDRHVLRFSGYFKEAVVETNLENYRVRKVLVFYYLEDDTCHVTEPRQENSGIPQGQLIRRHRFPTPSGGYLKPEDLQVGGSLQIYGKTVFLTDCDTFTRSFYNQHGIEQGPGMAQEVDSFQDTRDAMATAPTLQPRTYEKIYREVMLGGGHINKDMQQFLESDRKVLRFFAIMDDVSTSQFERRPFVILYFLADETVEVRELYPLNCGRDNFPIFFRRGKMPVGDISVLGPQCQQRSKGEYLDGRDLYIGMNVNLMNSKFFIYDADEFTRLYFQEQMGMELEPKVDVQLPERAVPKAPTPPYNGYGSWDDSLTSVTHLIPKAPKKDMVKLFNHEGKVLRFKAKFSNPKAEDVDRLFVVSYFLADDAVSIHEPPQRNLGIVTGRFLEKGVHMNQITGQLFTKDDLVPGNNIKVYNHEFTILDMDEYTRKTIVDINVHHRQFELEGVLQKIREAMRQQFPLIRDIFRRFDGDHDGVITLNEFRSSLAKFGFSLPESEVILLMKHFDKRQDGQVSYNEFCDALLDEDYTNSMLKTKPPLDQTTDANYDERCKRKLVERGETAEVRKSVRAVGDAIYQRQNVLYRLFREFKHLTHEDHVTCEQIQHALLQIGHTFDIADIHRVVLYIFPDADLNSVPYRELFKGVVATFHDTPTER